MGHRLRGNPLRTCGFCGDLAQRTQGRRPGLRRAHSCTLAFGLPRVPRRRKHAASPASRYFNRPCRSPGFSLSERALEARGGKTPPSIALTLRKVQLKAFPEIQPILLDLDAPEAFDAAVKAVMAAGWKIVEQQPPGGRSGLGHIDAIATSFILGFPSDITLRLRPLAGQTRVDIRSVSRFGLFDFGANPRNISNFEAALTAVVDKK